MRFVALFAILTIVFAGCMGEPRDTHFTVPEDAKSFQDAHTGDGYDLRIRVTDANGTPVAGAAVVWFTGGDGLVGFDGGRSVGPDGPRGEGSMTVSFSQSDADMIAGARTNDEGIATADLKPGRKVHVAAGDAPGLTTEVRFNVAVGSGGDAGTVTMVLYPDRVQLRQDVVMGEHLGMTPYGQAAYEAFPLALSPDAALDVELRSRLETMQIEATWENGLGSGADLYVGLGTDASAPRWHGDDQQQYVMDGRHTETLYLDDELPQARDDIAKRGLHTFLMTDWISGSVDGGVPVTMDVEATLKGSNVILS